MRWPTVGRAVLGLAAGLLIGYLLSRGVYVGSASMPNSASGLLVYDKRCLYLRFTGVEEVRINPGLDEEATQHTFCPLLRN